jgi:hypothetical protein
MQVRKRPLNKNELAKNEEDIIETVSNSLIVYETKIKVSHYLSNVTHASVALFQFRFFLFQGEIILYPPEVSIHFHFCLQSLKCDTLPPQTFKLWQFNQFGIFIPKMPQHFFFQKKKKNSKKKFQKKKNQKNI